MTGFRPPMLATRTDRRAFDDGWVAEPKLDGVRCLAGRSGDEVRLWSRTGGALERTYPEVAEALATQAMSGFLLDGEVVAFAGGRTSFERLQGRLALTDPDAARRTGIAVAYYVFDLLELDGHDTTGLPLVDRQALLADALDWHDPVRRSVPMPGSDAVALYEAACAAGEEGVVVKRTDSAYRGGRSGDWLKLKCVRDQEVVVGGWTDPTGGRRGLGALLVGTYEGDDLVYAGKVGTGFDDAMLARLGDLLAPLARDASPFTRGRPPRAHWVAPELVAQVGFSEWTSGGHLRHPRFRGLRDDKRPHDVVRES